MSDTKAFYDRLCTSLHAALNPMHPQNIPYDSVLLNYLVLPKHAFVMLTLSQEAFPQLENTCLSFNIQVKFNVSLKDSPRIIYLPLTTKPKFRDSVAPTYFILYAYAFLTRLPASSRKEHRLNIFVVLVIAQCRLYRMC